MSQVYGGTKYAQSGNLTGMTREQQQVFKKDQGTSHFTMGFENQRPISAVYKPKQFADFQSNKLGISGSSRGGLKTIENGQIS